MPTHSSEPSAINTHTSTVWDPAKARSTLLAMFMAAIEGTIVATAMPSIVGDLGGFAWFSWVFSAFLLAQAVSIPIYGKLADIYGRKSIFAFGAGIFMIGSLLCGFAHSMQQLILFRLLQGSGAGAVQPVAITIVGDIYSVSERAKVQGYISSVWGVAAIIGPAVGGLFVQYVSWSWVFWLNLPVGAVAITLLTLYLRENITKKAHKIDYIGSLLIFMVVGSCMITLVQGGVVWAWLSVQSILLMALTIFTLGLFIRHERKAVEPVMPLGIWRDSLILVGNLATMTTGAVIIGLSSFLPTYVQGVMGMTPIMAGFALAAMSIGWPMTSSISGRLLQTVSLRALAVVGGALIVLGSLFFVLLAPERGWIWAAAGSFIVGLGMGLARTVFIVSIQTSVAWETRGVVTASNMFMNILGNTLGAAALGALLNNRLSIFLRSAYAGSVPNLDVVNTLLDVNRRRSIPASTLHVMQIALAVALNKVFWGLFVVAVATLILVVFFPGIKLRGRRDGAQS